jgi:hypothetical protein
MKILRLESYEDALGNIGFGNEEQGQALMNLEDYKLSYLLDFETRESATFLNVVQLRSPFRYTLDIRDGEETRRQRVDLPETFSYLIGQIVERRTVHEHKAGKQSHHYLLYRGKTREADTPTAVLWREIEGWKEDDFQREKEWLASEKLLDGADRIYVNGTSAIEGAESLDPLRVHGSDVYFGLIYIGSTGEFRKLAEHETGVVTKEDAMAASLFAGVRADDSPVNLLIGARMFIEGWSSWRVSSMCLLNIARAEGSQVIQLFGRGVRLLGLNHSLKRSAYVAGVEHPQWLPSLERLFVFGVRANYMRSFKEDLLREGVDPEGYWEFELPLWKNTKFLEERLVIPNVPDESKFRRQVKLDLSTRLSSLRMAGAVAAERVKTQAVTGQLNGTLAMLRWDELYLALLDYAHERNYRNLVIPPEAPRAILSHQSPALYELTAPAEIFRPRDTRDWERLHEAALCILQKYTDAFYRNWQKRYETLNMRADRVREDHPNMHEPYRVQVPRSNGRLAEAIKELCTKAPKEIWRELERLKEHLLRPASLPTAGREPRERGAFHHTATTGGIGASLC